MNHGKRIVVALGGNAILQPGQSARYEIQLDNVKKSCKILAKLIRRGYQLVVTHGNGPQIGNLLRTSEIAEEVIPPMPMDVLNAQTQGFIGYMIEQSLSNELRKLGIHQPVVNLLTHVLVSKEDKGWKEPSKPIGSFFTKEHSEKLISEKGWVMKEDSGRGYRRVVSSPIPVEVLEKDVIRKLADDNNVVVAGGGGGIPVVLESDGSYRGVEAVVDKDLTGCEMAKAIHADHFMILTDVENVFIHYGKENQEAVGLISVSRLKQYVLKGHFAAGSMGPKVNAAIGFVEHTGGTAYICSLLKAEEALQGNSGTIIHP